MGAALDFLIQAGDDAREPCIVIAGADRDICRDLWTALFGDASSREIPSGNAGWTCVSNASEKYSRPSGLFAAAHIVLVCVPANDCVTANMQMLWKALLPRQIGLVAICSRAEGEKEAWMRCRDALSAEWKLSREKITGFVRETNAGATQIAARIYDTLPMELASGFARQCAIQSIKVKESRRAARQTAVKAAVIGGIPIPFPDMMFLTPLQMRMVHRIARLYGRHLDSKQIRELIGVVAGGMVLRTAARQALKFLPGLGPMITASVAFAGTMGIAEAARAYFESGLTANPDKLRNIYKSVMRQARRTFENDTDTQKRIRRLCLQYEVGAITKEEFERELEALGLTPADVT